MYPQDICIAEARVRAFMRMLRIGEGTEEEKGYTTAFGNNKFTDLSKHPEKNYGGSTAAGAYQFMRYTWWELNGHILDENYKKTGKYSEAKDYIKKYKIPDYSPLSQDKLCIIYMKHYKSGLIELIINGQIETAIRSKASAIWASLPHKDDNSRYKFKGKLQPTTPMKKCLEHYHDFFKKEMKGDSDLHLQNGFLKQFGFNCCNDDSSIDYNGAPWMKYVEEEAIKYNGIKEWVEPLSSTIKNSYHNYVGLNKTHKTAWCASFASWALNEAGLKNPKSARSQNFLAHHSLKNTTATYGAIMVFTNCKSNGELLSSGGHVGFLFGHIKDDYYACLGGNQGDRLKVTKYDCSGNAFLSYTDKNGVKHYKKFRGFYIPSNATPDAASIKTYSSAKKANQELMNTIISESKNGESTT